MILPTEEALERRRQGYRRRGVVCAVGGFLVLLSIVVPHIAVTAYEGGSGIYRSLFPAMHFFSSAVPSAEGFPAGVDESRLGFGIVVTYAGLVLQHLGLLGGVGTFWVLAAEDVGRWTRRILFLAGLCFVLSASTVVMGYLLITSTGVGVSLGVAWLVDLLAGGVLLGGAVAATRRMDSTWFLNKPELIT